MKNQAYRKANHPKQVTVFRGILFDIGDTLIAASQIMSEALDTATDLLRLNGYVTDTEKFKQAYRKADRSIQGSHINHLFSDICIVKETWRKLGLPTSYPAYGIFIVAFRNQVRANIGTSKEIVKLFKLLKDRGLRLGVVTDGTVVEQLETLVCLGIIKYVDAVVVSEEFETEKPDPCLFKAALDQLGLKPEETLMVGDDLARDIAGARNIGMKTALITEYGDKGLSKTRMPPADFAFSKIAGILSLVG